jgi:predicted phage terminase large subunit-like protein
MNDLTAEEFHALLRQDPLAFAHQSFNYLHPALQLSAGWYIEAILAKLEECRLGKCQRLILNLPPRFLKSLLASVVFPARVLGHDPTRQILCLSFSQDLANKFARDCLSLMTSPWYKRTFPKTLLSGKRPAAADFSTTANGGRIASGLRGSITGRGADFIIIDDAIQPEEALSDRRRNAVNEWMGSTAYGRLNDTNKGCIIIVMQRLHPDDLVGYLLQQNDEEWEILSFPAIAEQAETYRWKTTSGTFSYHRAVGDVLDPERQSREQLEARKAEIGEYNFAAQYQQNPMPPDGGWVKREWLQYYTDENLPDGFDFVIDCWDTANKRSELNDYSVCATLGVKGRNIYLLDIWRQRVDYSGLKRAVEQQHLEYHSGTILIEDNASGVQLLQQLRESGLPVAPYKSRLDKVMRFSAQTGIFKDRLFHLPQRTHWLDAFQRELLTFPASRFDDQVDAISMGLEWISLEWSKRTATSIPMIKAHELLSGAELRKLTQTIELQAPHGNTHVYTRHGQMVLVGNDGRIRLSPDDAIPLLSAGFKRVG